MTFQLKNLLLSLAIFIGILLLVYLLGLQQSDGIISIAWFYFMLQLVFFGVLGLILFIVRKFRKSSKPPKLIYFLCGVATFGNALIGAYFLWTGDPAYPSTSLWFALGATACVAFLILSDIFF